MDSPILMAGKKSWSWSLSFYPPLIVLFSFLFFKAIYNRYLHPIARFPGPFCGSITSLYFAYIIASVPTYGLDLHRRYGPIVRLAPNLLSFSEAKLLPKVYHRHADKPPFYGTWLFGDTAAMFQTLSHEKHAMKKRVIAPCCSMKAIKGFEDQISERVLELCNAIRKRSVLQGKKLDFSEHLRWFLSDVFSQMTYGEPISCVSRGEDVDGHLEAIQNLYAMAATVAVLPWPMQPILRHPWMRKYLLLTTKTFKSMKKLYRSFHSRVSKREETPALSKAECLFDGLSLPEGHTGYRMNKEDFKAEVITFTAATLDGVAAFISPFIDNVIQHPAVYAKLIAEIDTAEENGNLSYPIVSYEETTKLTYFMACINETLRRDAPAQTILPRYVSKGGLKPHDDSSIWIPEGTEMGASPYIIHRDPSIFGKDADTFRPERWLGDPVQAARMEQYGMWWGFGDRECVAKNFAQVEMQKLCLQLFRDFEISSAAPEQRFTHERWAVGMFWRQWLLFKERSKR